MVDEMRDYARNFDWFAAAPVVIAVAARDPDAFLGHLLGALAHHVEHADQVLAIGGASHRARAT